MIPTEVAAAEPNLIVREIPPAVSMFRGFAGNDCSTLCSFPFTNSPNEYTFLVYDSKGGVKGYVQGTKVLVEGQTAFYLHTIAGPRISTQDTLHIIKAFTQEKQSFGFQTVLLPPLKNLEEMINFLPVREAVKHVLTSSSKALHYQDSELRDTFKKTFSLSKTYDDAANNPLGYEIDERKLGAEVRIVRKESPSLSEVQTQMDKNALIGMLLTMGKKLTSNQAMIEALAPHAGVSYSQVRQLIQLATNNQKLSSADFIRGFEHSLRENGFTFKEGYFKKNLSLVAQGLLQSPDVIANVQTGEPVLMNLLEQREFAQVERFIIKNTKFFKSSLLTQTFLKAFYIDVHEANFGSTEALTAALKANPESILKDKATLEILGRSQKAVAAIADYLNLNPQRSISLDKQAGRAIFVELKERSAIINHIVLEARSAKTEKDYENALSKFEATKLSKSSYDVKMQYKKMLTTLTAKKAASFKSGSATTEALGQLQTSVRDYNDPSVRRTLRVLLSSALSGSSTNLDLTLNKIARIRGQMKDTTEIDAVIVKNLAARPDAHELAAKYKYLIPNLNWNKISAIRCDRLFL